MKLNADQLRKLEEERAQGSMKQVKRNPIYFVLENIYDTYNIGGLFRLADALAIEKIYLCGDSEIPPNARIKKASIGTYKVVPWEYRKSAADTIADLNLKAETRNSKQFQNSKNQNSTTPLSPPYQGGETGETSNEVVKQLSNNLNIIAVEQSDKSVPYTKVNYSLPLVLIFGNESYGIKEETLKLADQIVEIPMFGINKSLNVIVSAAIVSYWVISKIKT
ncbi:hypothetical protein A2774_01560 [Candidatus Roizmanbacteria bacterium RIFCSPHIGHO2_01_FULL_39_12c]|uniref:tRNA/rRNA methyltransferase SpoU type domain-containing protein n=1 Tax=Candidatus Roizmanbacteria bacterium RIFCSPHIGHO2_01_FULL_39_12c TaxID=1802031 RepID=A0A1F7G8Q0_9BACT|nr:MAG: hypothetical protein A2774_01560 [Candidatus Roizmanbacteria bacterium RIFCSPHIGHO2_01_FULL_39_12c]OGK46590.1 MAG: hypothetical protein A2963_02565 [Candidatus Roizmanbacteria bacterium RIFCSPLOWO2_01_FULL_40_13]